MKIKQVLTENLGVKLIAVVVAVFIWFNASGQQEVARVRTIPLVVENLPDSLTITSPIPSHVEINVRATKRALITMGFKRVNLSVDLTGSQPGRQRVALTSNHVGLPGGIDRRQITIMSPRSLDFEMESLVTKTVEVSLTTTGAVPDGLVLMGETIAITPSSTTVRGAASRIERVQAIPTQQLDLSRVRSSVDREVELDYDRDLYTCEPDRVRVTAVVSERGQRVLANIPPTVLVDSDDYVARVIPGTVSLTLEGAVPVLDTLSSGDVSVLLNLSGREPNRYRMAPEVMLPPGVILAGMSVDTLTVEISRGGRVGTPDP
jgi:YbbR domain-containing protein